LDNALEYPSDRLTRISLFLLFLLVLSLAIPLCSAQTQHPVSITVRADQSDGKLSPIWNYFGYDEPNYTYAPNGRKLLGELSALSAGPVYVRVHNLFTSGDGSASLKWGSTNVYTEDEHGNPVYSWTIVDRIFDTFHAAGVRPLVELGFMPRALSTHPDPYRHDFPRTSVTEIYTGWAYPPKDYQKWSELVFQFVHHLRERYGDDEVKTWLWEVWNEPDIGYWKGTLEEFFKLYDFSVDAALRALPQARIGGPDTTGPGSARSSDFLRGFLEHCAHGKNFATGTIGTRLDFISFHPKGSPAWKENHVQMGLSHQLAVIDAGFKIVASFPEWRQTPIIFGESDPEGCAACSAKENPQNGYRNGPLYGAYTVETLSRILQLAEKDNVNFMGAVTWAFEFEDQPNFAGFRELASDGLDKPVLNAFRMLGLLGEKRVTVTNSGALPTDDVVLHGVRGQDDIGAVATRKDREAEVLLWNYHDDDVSVADALVELEIDGLPGDVKRGLIEHFRMDSDHSNTFAAWQEMGSPEAPSDEQYRQLESAGRLQMLNSPAWVDIRDGKVKLQFLLPRQAISLFRIAW
jgi:xylan 1,4-beta-xylosidase